MSPGRSNLHDPTGSEFQFPFPNITLLYCYYFVCSKRASSVLLATAVVRVGRSVGRGVKLSRESEGIHRSLSLKGNRPPATSLASFLHVTAARSSFPGPPKLRGSPSSFAIQPSFGLRKVRVRDVSSYCSPIMYCIGIVGEEVFPTPPTPPKPMPKPTRIMITIMIQLQSTYCTIHV